MRIRIVCGLFVGPEGLLLYLVGLYRRKKPKGSLYILCLAARDAGLCIYNESGERESERKNRIATFV